MNPSDVVVEVGQPLGMQPLTPASQLQQQQSSVVIVDTPTPQYPPLIQSFAGHIVLACCTFWCCGVGFGLVAFILAGTVHDNMPSIDQFHANLILMVEQFWQIGSC